MCLDLYKEKIRMEKLLFDYLSQYITLSDEEKTALLDLDIFKQYKKGTILLKEGAISTNIYFVLKGCIRSYYVVDGDEKTTAFYTEAETLNPPCVITGKPSEFYVSCVENSILIVESLCRILSEKLLAKNKTEFDDFKISSPEQRYLNLLRTRPDLLQRVPQYQLASFLGITAQSLSRMRNRIVKTPAAMLN